jgi:hypothetical protein
MPISNQQAEKAYKKLQGLALTGNGRYTFNEPFYAPVAVNPQQIWLEQGLIPKTAPVLANNGISGVVQRIIALSLTAVDGTTNSFYSSTLKDAIPSAFGAGYTITLTDKNGTVIDLGVNDWEVDTEAGVLTFFGINGNNAAPANMPPKISFYKYVGAKGNTVVYLEQSGGVANTYTFTTESISNYTGNAVYILKVSQGNTGTATLKINELTAKNIKKSTGSGLADLATGDLKAGVNYLLAFDKTSDCFQIVSGSGGGGGDSNVAVVTVNTADWTALATSPVTYKNVISYSALGFTEAGSVEVYENISGNQYRLAQADVMLDLFAKTITVTSLVNTKAQVRMLGSGTGAVTPSGTAQTNTDSVEYLNDLSDVTIGTAATNDVLMYNGSAWVNSSGFARISDTTTTSTSVWSSQKTQSVLNAQTHTISDITGLQDALNGKGTVKSVNNSTPDASGNVTISVGEESGSYLPLSLSVNTIVNTNTKKLSFETRSGTDLSRLSMNDSGDGAFSYVGIKNSNISYIQTYAEASTPLGDGSAVMIKAQRNSTPTVSATVMPYIGTDDGGVDIAVQGKGVIKTFRFKSDGKIYVNDVVYGGSSGTTTTYTASSALVSDASGNVTASTTSASEIGYVKGVTSGIQLQLNGKASTTHTHNSINVEDTRSTNATPSTYANMFTAELKTTSVVSLSQTNDGGEPFTGLMTIAPWVGTTVGGVKNYQLGFNGGKIHFRSGIESTWGTWDRVLTNTETSSVNSANSVIRRDANGDIGVNTISALKSFELNTYGGNGLFSGNKDAASRTEYNMYMKGHNGMAFRTYDETVTGVLDFRTGSFDMDGSFTGRNFINPIDDGEKSFRFNTKSNAAGFGMYGNSTKLGFYDWDNNKSFLSITRTTGKVVVDGDLQAVSLTVGNLTSTGTLSLASLSMSGNLTVTGTITTNAALSASSISTSGNASITGTVSTGGISISGNASISGTLSTTSISATGNISTTGTLSASSNISTSGGSVSTSLIFASTSTSSMDLHVNGAKRASLDSSGNFVATGNVSATSDARVKDNVTSITGALEKIGKLNGVYYTRNDRGNTKELGLIAQEVKEVLPELVLYNQSEDLHSLDYSKITAVLINAVKEQQAQIAALNKKIDDMRNE